MHDARTQAEREGFLFRRSAASAAEDPVAIVAANGANIARLRVWHDPPYPNQTYANVTNAVRMARRVHAAGMLVHLDLFFSDWWADPGQQWMPRAWSGCPDCACVEGRGCACNAGRGCRPRLDPAALRRLAYSFTKDVVSRVAAAIGEPPHIVQVGNEITNGFMWAPPVAPCSDGGATWRPGNVSACQARCAVDPTTNDTSAHLLRCRYMCGTTGASDCGPDTENKSAPGGWAGTCATAFVDQQRHCSNWPVRGQERWRLPSPLPISPASLGASFLAARRRDSHAW